MVFRLLVHLLTNVTVTITDIHEKGRERFFPLNWDSVIFYFSLMVSNTFVEHVETEPENHQASTEKLKPEFICV